MGTTATLYTALCLHTVHDTNCRSCSYLKQLRNMSYLQFHTFNIVLVSLSNKCKHITHHTIPILTTYTHHSYSPLPTTPTHRSYSPLLTKARGHSSVGTGNHTVLVVVGCCVPCVCVCVCVCNVPGLMFRSSFLKNCETDRACMIFCC